MLRWVSVLVVDGDDEPDGETKSRASWKQESARSVSVSKVRKCSKIRTEAGPVLLGSQ